MQACPAEIESAMHAPQPDSYFKRDGKKEPCSPVEHRFDVLRILKRESDSRFGDLCAPKVNVKM